MKLKTILTLMYLWVVKATFNPLFSISVLTYDVNIIIYCYRPTS